MSPQEQVIEIDGVIWEPRRFVAYGPGFSGDYDSYEEAAAVVRANRAGAVYERVEGR